MGVYLQAKHSKFPQTLPVFKFFNCFFSLRNSSWNPFPQAEPTVNDVPPGVPDLSFPVLQAYIESSSIIADSLPISVPPQPSPLISPGKTPTETPTLNHIEDDDDFDVRGSSLPSEGAPRVDLLVGVGNSEAKTPETTSEVPPPVKSPKSKLNLAIEKPQVPNYSPGFDVFENSPIERADTPRPLEGSGGSEEVGSPVEPSSAARTADWIAFRDSVSALEGEELSENRAILEDISQIEAVKVKESGTEVKPSTVLNEVDEEPKNGEQGLANGTV